MKHGILPFVTSFRHFAQSLADPFRARIASEEDPVETHKYITEASFSFALIIAANSMAEGILLFLNAENAVCPICSWSL